MKSNQKPVLLYAGYKFANKGYLWLACQQQPQHKLSTTHIHLSIIPF